MRAFTILRLRALEPGQGRGFTGQIVCDGLTESFRVSAYGHALTLTLAGQSLDLAVDAFAACACRWSEIGDAVRAGIAQILNSPRYEDVRCSARAA